MHETVADILATGREEYGQDLRSVSDALRIRYVYLQAIEEGRFDDLPGLTYAVGFVRSYCDYLGLDTPTIVQQFKEEMGGASQRQQLVFPVPKPEGKIPAGALVLISILLVAIGYGGWYVLSQDDQSFMEMFSGEESSPSVSEPAGEGPDEGAAPDAEPQPDPEPESNAGGAGESETVSAPATEPEAEPAPAPELVDDAVEEVTEVVENSADAAAGAAEAVVESEVLTPPSEVTPSIEVMDTPTSGLTSGTVQEVGDGTAGEEGAVAAEALDAQPADEPADTQSAELPAAPAAAAPTESASGEVFGAPTDDPVRVVIEATHDSWVQVFDAENELLIARVLRAGDQFRVPNSEGMSMLTGNAGGLEVAVDGAPAPSLGPFGEVVRNIALDPVLLLNGTAVGAADNPQQ